MSRVPVRRRGRPAQGSRREAAKGCGAKRFGGAPLVPAGGEEAWAARPAPEARAGRPGAVREGGRGCGQPAASHTAGGGLWRVHGAVKLPTVSHASRSVKSLRGCLTLLTRNQMFFFF